MKNIKIRFLSPLSINDFEELFNEKFDFEETLRDIIDFENTYKNVIILIKLICIL